MPIQKTQYDLIVIGGGIAGMTATLAALEEGIERVLLLEREEKIGGVLNQCIHNGFGKKLLKVSLTGPEYINIIREKLENHKTNIVTNSEVIDISADRVVTYVNPVDGVVEVKGTAIILATGCREKYTGSIAIPTNKFTGIYTVGNVHRIVNIEGYLPGKEPVIAANDKWALVVARRLYIEGADIKALIINDNQLLVDSENRQIIEDFDIPIIENSVISEVIGEERVRGVKIKNIATKKDTIISCDSLLLSVSYLPEDSLIRKLKVDIDEYSFAPKVDDFRTSLNGIFACGNLIFGTKALEEKDVNGFPAGKKASEYIKRIIY